MAETIYPWEVETYDSVMMLRAGMIVPQFAQSSGIVKCSNCKDPDGFLYARKIIGDYHSCKGPIHYFDDRHGNIRLMRASLRSAPCPVCRPHKQPKVEEAKEEEKELWSKEEQAQWFDKV